jgi:hypothetical protein
MKIFKVHRILKLEFYLKKEIDVVDNVIVLLDE